jgi:hypothetical protein
MPPPTLWLDSLWRRTLLSEPPVRVMPVVSESLALLPSIRFPIEFRSEMPPLLPLTSFPRMTLSFAR